MAKNNSEEFDFHYFVDAVKQKKIRWDIFVGLIQDFSYSDLKRLRTLNAILLTDLIYNKSQKTTKHAKIYQLKMKFKFQQLALKLLEMKTRKCRKL